jgi:excisionase family DNA binding protein
MAERETVTKRKAADILGVHPSTVQRMIESGRLEATRIGGNDRTAMYVIYRSHVDRLARQRKAAA